MANPKVSGRVRITLDFSKGVSRGVIWSGATRESHEIVPGHADAKVLSSICGDYA